MALIISMELEIGWRFMKDLDKYTCKSILLVAILNIRTKSPFINENNKSN